MRDKIGKKVIVPTPSLLQVCRIPNKHILAFRGGQMGCLTVLFSHAGTVLAAACADRDAFPVVGKQRLIVCKKSRLCRKKSQANYPAHATSQSLTSQ